MNLIEMLVNHLYDGGILALIVCIQLHISFLKIMGKNLTYTMFYISQTS